MPLTGAPPHVKDAIAFSKGFIPESPVPVPAVGAAPLSVTLTRDSNTYRLDLRALYDGVDLLTYDVTRWKRVILPTVQALYEATVLTNAVVRLRR